VKDMSVLAEDQAGVKVLGTAMHAILLFSFATGCTRETEWQKIDLLAGQCLVHDCRHGSGIQLYLPDVSKGWGPHALLFRAVNIANGLDEQPGLFLHHHRGSLTALPANFGTH
jgi:hypothetical protein